MSALITSFETAKRSFAAGWEGWAKKNERESTGHRRGRAIRSSRSRNASALEKTAEQLGWATRSRVEHAKENWPHAIAWSVILLSAYNMHSSVIINTAACAIPLQLIPPLPNQHLQSAVDTYSIWTSHLCDSVNDDITKPIVGAILMVMAALARHHSPLFREMAWPATALATLFTGVAASSYFKPLRLNNLH